MNIKNKLKTLALASLLYTAIPCFAGSPFGLTSIQTLTVHDYGNQILIYGLNPIANGEGCKETGFLVLEKTHPFFNQMYASLLATFLTKGSFTGWVGGCDPTFGAAILARLDLQRPS